MVEKRVEKADAAISDVIPEAEAREAALDKLPGGLKPLPTIRDEVALQLLELAERQVAEARKQLGNQTSKPRLKRIEAMFTAAAGKPPHVGEELERMMRSSALASKVATFDGTFDHSLAVAYNLFDKASAEAGASLQIAYDDWSMATRIYKSELRAAGAIMAASIEIARHPAPPSDYEQPVRGEQQVEHYVRADKIGAALLTYERRMQQAAAALATAYGALMTALYGALGTLAVAEATAIAVAQTTHKTFWTSVQGAVAQVRN